MNVQAKPALLTLREFLGRERLGPETESLFLTGYLSQVGVLAVGPEEFDAAAGAFLKASGLSASLWLNFLAHAVQDHLATLPSDAGYVEYLSREVPAFLALLTEQAPPAEPVPPPLVQTLRLSPDEAAFMADCFRHKTALRGTQVGLPLLSWWFSHPEAGHSDERFTVEVVNAEGGPALVGYHYKGARLLEATKPQHEAVRELLFCLNGRLRVVFDVAS